MAENLWRGVAAAYERSFASLCSGTTDALLERIPGDSRVLDVGCGSGRLAAALAGRGHRVTAVDPGPGMVALAGAHPGVTVVEGGLPDLPVAPGSMEVVLANFVLNHVDDPRAGAAGLARVLAPRGRVIATIWPADPPSHNVLWDALLDAAGADRPALPRLVEHLDFERSADGLSGLLVGAGLEVVEATAPAWEWRVRPEDFWVGATEVGNHAVTWRAQDKAVRQRMRAAYRVEQQPWRSGAELVFPARCVLVEAVRPPE